MKGNKPTKFELKLDEKRNMHNHQYVKQKRRWRNPQNENGGYQREKEEVVAWEKWPKNVVTSILPLRITKMLSCHSELQKCHSATQNYKNVILLLRITKMPLWAKNACPMTWTGWLTWRRRDNDVEITWQLSLDLKMNVQAPKLLHPNT